MRIYSAISGRFHLLPILAVTLALLTACSNVERERNYPSRDGANPSREFEGKLFGGNLFRFGDVGDEERGGAPGLGVNAFLWRASLDTIAFMPVISADPFGGVILTDWYSPPESDGQERFKVNIYILDRQLRADAIQVSAFRQVRDRQGGWLDAPVAGETTLDLENAILTRARQLRASQMAVQ